MKRSDYTNVHNNWLELYSQRDEPVTLTEIIRGRPGGLGQRYPIIRCFNTKDMTDDANFEPCILVKVRNDQFEVMDVNDDTKLEDDLDWKGDHGLEPNWNMYYKYPSEEFVQSYRRDLELVEDTQDAVNESPRREGLRKKAAENMAKKGASVKKKILEKWGTLYWCRSTMLIVQR